MAAIPVAPQSSRIFVENLPPSLGESDFKSHFAEVAPITDAKLMPRRRIGYVGYKSEEEAAKAVKYFNKSFIRMSRIAVELARPASDVKPQLRDRRSKPSSEEQKQPWSRSPETSNNLQAKTPKLNEFLNVMAPSSRSKTWTNEDIAGAPLPEPAIPDAAAAESKEENEQEYQTVPKKRKRAPEEGEGYASGGKSPPIPPEERRLPDPTGAAEELLNGLLVGSDGEDGVENNGGEMTSQPLETGGKVKAAVSDSDWLRSKTSRLLGLMDDEEYEDIEEHQRENQDLSRVEKLERKGRQQVSPSPSMSDPASQTEPDTKIEEKQDGEARLAGNDHPAAEPPEDLSDSRRLFVRNLPYSVTEEDLSRHFSSYGSVEEIHISRDTRSGSGKGFGYISFVDAQTASVATSELDGKPFQGRLLHIIPSLAKRETGLDEYAISKLPLKKQQQIRKKAEAAKATFKWNSMYMNPDAIVSSIAERLGMSKSETLDPTSSDTAVKQAHAEANVIQEAKDYFTRHGVDLDAFKKKTYDEKAILVKNFPYGTTAEEIRRSFEPFGTVKRMLMPSSATIAIVEMEQPTQARSAFKSLAYRKFKDSVLFLEKAPKGVFEGEIRQPETQAPLKEGKIFTSDLLEQREAVGPALTSTLYVRNLNFSTTSEDLRDLFRPLNGFLSARVKTKSNTKKPGEILSMGFGFIEFKSKEDARSALRAINGYKLAGHELIIKESHKALDAAEERRREDVAKKLAGRRTKIIIKNLPFEATTKDVRSLFGPYGQLKSVRVPKKFDSSSRGFAFANFVTSKEAENAIKALEGVHLLGRRLNLDFASEEAMDPEEEIEKMQRKVEKQTDKVAIQNLTAGGRKKFSVHQGEDAEID